IGFMKPDPASYLWVAKKLGAAPSECMMIDDRMEWCIGAEAADMQSIHFKSLEQLKVELGKIITK
ncbi:MAG: HAD-IA family hydrolase, partial [Microcoleus sp.]